jgi:hypothetical protein
VRKSISLLLIPVFALTLTMVAPVAQADAQEAAHKFGRGFAHFWLAPFHIPKRIIQTTSDTEPYYIAPFKGMTVGLGEGLFNMGRQWISAFRDIFTFWIPGDPLYEPESLFPEI